MSKTKLPPIHPGEVLQEEFLVPLKVSQSQLARDTAVSEQLAEMTIECLCLQPVVSTGAEPSWPPSPARSRCSRSVARARSAPPR